MEIQNVTLGKFRYSNVFVFVYTSYVNVTYIAVNNLGENEASSQTGQIFICSMGVLGEGEGLVFGFLSQT